MKQGLGVTGLGALDDLVGLQLRLAQLQFFAHYYKRFADTGLSPAEHAVLSLLAEHAGIRQGELGDILRIKRSNMTKIMRALERRGLIWRVVPESDARAFEVRLTEQGDALQASLADQVYETDRQSTSALTGRERAELLRLLKKLNAAHGVRARDQVAEGERVHG